MVSTEHGLKGHISKWEPLSLLENGKSCLFSELAVFSEVIVPLIERYWAETVSSSILNALRYWLNLIGMIFLCISWSNFSCFHPVSGFFAIIWWYWSRTVSIDVLGIFSFYWIVWRNAETSSAVWLPDEKKTNHAQITNLCVTQAIFSSSDVVLQPLLIPFHFSHQLIFFSFCNSNFFSTWTTACRILLNSRPVEDTA